MSELFWLTDEQVARLQPFFPKSHGRPRVDDRREMRRVNMVRPKRSTTAGSDGVTSVSLP